MATVHTAYQGIEVLDSDPEVKCRHPRWGYAPDTLATLKGATLLALADGVYLVVCDECGYNGLTGRDPYVKPEGDYLPIIKQADSLLAHINGMHHPNKGNRRDIRYTDDQIKVAIKIWLKWKSTGLRNWTQRACEELEQLGFKPFMADHWNTGQLGNLVRDYIKKDPFKNLKAAPMDEDDKRVLADMIRDAAAREGKSGGTHLADNVRITTTVRGTAKQTRAEHRPVDFAGIIAANEAAKDVRPEEEEDVPAGSSSPAPNPTLVFGGSGNASAPAVVKTLVVDTSDEVEKPARRTTGMARIAEVAEQMAAQAAPVVQSDYVHVASLPDGSPMFTYKGDLMVGKKVKDVQI